MDILELAKSINKEVGIKEGGVQVLSKSATMDIERLPIGSLSYDILSGGGWKKGAHNTIYGQFSSGKTTSALMTIAKVQASKDKRPVLYIDSETAVDKKYAASLGVDIDNLLIIQPDDLEQGSEVMKKVINDGSVSLIVVDSIATFKPKKIMEEGVSAHNIGLHAKGLRALYTAITTPMAKNEVTVLWINQETENPGSFTGGVSHPGGTAPDYYSSITINVYRGSKEAEKEGEGFVNKGSCRCTKNKTSSPYREAKYTMRHGTGICVSTEVLDFGAQIGVLYKKGHSFYYDETFKNDEESRKDHILLGSGKDAARLFLDDNLELRDHLYKTILFNWFNEEN